VGVRWYLRLKLTRKKERGGGGERRRNGFRERWRRFACVRLVGHLLVTRHTSKSEDVLEGREGGESKARSRGRRAFLVTSSKSPLLLRFLSRSVRELKAADSLTEKAEAEGGEEKGGSDDSRVQFNDRRHRAAPHPE